MEIKKIINLFFVITFLMFTLFTFPIDNSIKATSVNYDFGFEGTVAGVGITNGLPVGSDNIFTSDKEGSETVNFAVSSTSYRSGNRCFKWGADSSGYFNTTYSKSSYLINFSIWINVADAFMIFFYNSSIGISLGTIVLIKFVTTGADLFYNGESNTSVLIDTDFSGGYQMLSFGIDNSLGDITYMTDTSKVYGVGRNPLLIGSGYRIDRIKFHDMSSGTFYFDDMNWTLSSSYEGSGGIPSDCDELYINDQWIGTGFQNCLGTIRLMDVLIPTYVEKYVELCNGATVTGSISGFEIATGTTMYSLDNDLSNYYLYINGMSLGNPCQSEGFMSGTTPLNKFKWDITGLTLENETIVIELFHDSSTYGWQLGYNGDFTDLIGPPFPDNSIYHSHISFINGIMDFNITDTKLRAMYKIYFNNISSGGENPDYDNSLVIQGNGINESDGIQWTYQYDTILFDVHINDTIYDYSINVYKNDIQKGLDQYYPISITTYQEVHGYSPKEIGLYKVKLLREGDIEVLNETFWVINNTKSYAIMTYPNPSFLNNDYTVEVYINDGELFNNYYARAFVYSTDTYYYDRGFGGSAIYLDANFYTFNFAHNEGNLDYHYWRIFGTNDDIIFLPLGDVHNHLIDRSLTDTPYLSLSTYSILLGDTIHILGFHPIGFDYTVFIGSTPSFDVSDDTIFNIPFKPSNKGVYTITLKNKVNGVWIIPNNDCIQTLTVLENTSDGDGGGGVFNLVIPTPYSYFAGIFVIILLTLSPLAMVVFMSKSTGRDFNISSIPQILYLIMAIIGFVITILFGWFPVWTVVVLISLCAVVITIIYLQKKSSTE